MTQKTICSTRKQAYDVLNLIMREGAYSNLALKEALKNTEHNHAARITALVYCTVEHCSYADYLIAHYAKGRIHGSVRIVLQMGIAEMLFMNTPDHVVCSESVELIRSIGKGSLSCYVNGVLKTQIDKYVGNYRYMVVDNEAGLEHISRGTLPHVDTMLLISDCSRRGVQAVGRIAEMIRELDLKPGEMKLIVNRAPNGELNPGVMEEINKYGLQLAGVLPQDDTVYTYDCEGKPSSQVPDTAPVKKALAAIMQELKL